VSRGLLRPLNPLYGAAIAVKNAAYDRGWISAERLRRPVVSVGNLSVGGSGKTPLVIRLAQLLTAQGLAVDVLSRGYGRSSTAVERVDPFGSAEQFGDEPLLIAQKAGVPVYVGASRYAAGVLAERESAGPELPGRGVHLLDDGFQHRKLARDVDIVVVHGSDFRQRLLPAGRLREPLSSLRRASAIVLRSEDAGLETRLEMRLGERGVRAPIWIQHRRLAVETRGRAVAFCGIAHPDEFFSALRANGVDLVATRAFRDHHRYTDADVDAVLKLCMGAGAEVCVTTEKDAVRLSPKQRARLASGSRLETARLEVSLADEAVAVEQLLAMLVRK
jgi:tetraacyldisaccharide 4'-kinase